MKKILVWETLSLVSGGQRVTLTVLDSLKDKYEFHCLIPNKGALSDELDIRGIPYTFMGDQTMPMGIKGKSVIFKYGWLSVKALSKALRVIRREKPDIIYAPGPAALPWSAFCGSLTGKSVIWHLHHIFLDGATKELLNKCCGWKSVTKIISVSNIVGDQIINEKAKSKKITVFNPVDNIKYAGGNGEKILDELSFTDREQKVLLGHVALLQSSKRQDVVIGTVKELRERGYDAYALLVGRAREEDADYVNTLRRIISENQLSDYVRLMGQRSDVPDILNAVDVLMIPSSFEGFPLAGLEACAAGVPVIAADVGGCFEFIEVSKSGSCFVYEKVDKAADAVVDVLSPEIRKTCIENGKRFANQHTLDTYKCDMALIFQEVV